jgi:hypothetical protein
MTDLTVRHRLTDVDLVAKTGVCVVCGPIDIRLKGGTKRECMGKRRAQGRAARFRDHVGAEEAYARLIVKQGGVCAICKLPPKGSRFSIDHDHSCCPGRDGCGRCIRGLLCSSCNMGLGYFRDDKERLKRAVAYLSRSGA